MDNRQQIFFEVKIDYQRSALNLSSKFRAQSSELKVQSSKLKVQSSELRTQSSRFL